MFPLYNPNSDSWQAFASAESNDIAMQNTISFLQQAADCARKAGDDVTNYFDTYSFYEIFVKKGCDIFTRWKTLDLSTEDGIAAVQKLPGWEEWEPGDTNGRGASMTSAFFQKVAKEVETAMESGSLSGNAKRFVELTVNTRPALATELAKTITLRNRKAANLGD